MATIAEKEAIIKFDLIKNQKELEALKWKKGHEAELFLSLHEAELSYYEGLKLILQRDLDEHMSLCKFHFDQKIEMEDYFLQQFWKHLEEQHKCFVSLYEQLQSLSGISLL